MHPNQIRNACASLHFFLFIFFAAFLNGTTANAHTTKLTTGTLSLSQEAGPAIVSFALTLSTHDLAFAVGQPILESRPVTPPLWDALEHEASSYVERAITLTADGTTCSKALRFSHGASLETVYADILFTCPSGSRALFLDYRLFFEIDEEHSALITLEFGETAGSQIVFNTYSASLGFDLQNQTSANLLERLTRLIILGAEHILIGIDHILFLIALLIGIPRLVPIIKLATAFTLGHSMTLGLAWYGLFEIPGSIVEPIIAASILYVACENLLRGNPLNHRWVTALLFGLVHGLGFYGALTELNLDTEHAALVLFGFNLGVEVGQILIIAMILPILILIRDREYFRSTIRIASVFMIVIALYWVAERVGLI